MDVKTNKDFKYTKINYVTDILAHISDVYAYKMVIELTEVVVVLLLSLFCQGSDL